MFGFPRSLTEPSVGFVKNQQLVTNKKKLKNDQRRRRRRRTASFVLIDIDIFYVNFLLFAGRCTVSRHKCSVSQSTLWSKLFVWPDQQCCWWNTRHPHHSSGEICWWYQLQTIICSGWRLLSCSKVKISALVLTKITILKFFYFHEGTLFLIREQITATWEI